MNSKNLLLTLSFLINLQILSSCLTKEEPEAVWEPDVYAGDHESKSIVRNELDFIKCDDVKFSEFVCMHKDDVEHMFKVCLKVSGK